MEKQVSDVVQSRAALEGQAQSSPKDKSYLLRFMRHALEACSVDVKEPVLVLGGGQEDIAILSACGFEEIVLSNLDSDGTALDAEDIALPDNSYPVVFAHAVLHHCRCPQKAVGEMVRVSQKHAFFVEPNESWALRSLVRLGLSFPYELAAVAYHGYVSGGMRDGPIPNYIYRWTGREVEKSVLAYHPQQRLLVRPHAYWDFYVNEVDLLARKESRIAGLATRVGTTRFLGFLHFCQSFLNVMPLLRSQGNKFFCAISKKELHPWIEQRDGQFWLKREVHDSDDQIETTDMPTKPARRTRCPSRIGANDVPNRRLVEITNSFEGRCYLQWPG